MTDLTKLACKNASAVRLLVIEGISAKITRMSEKKKEERGLDREEISQFYDLFPLGDSRIIGKPE